MRTQEEIRGNFQIRPVHNVLLLVKQRHLSWLLTWHLAWHTIFAMCSTKTLKLKFEFLMVPVTVFLWNISTMIFFFSREQTVSKICEDVGVAVWWFHCSLVVDSSRDGIHCQHCGNPRSIFIFNFYKFFFFKFGLIDRVLEFFLCSSNL